MKRTYDFKWFKVRWMPRYGWIMDRGMAVVVVPVAADGKLWIARMKRVPTGRTSWELPGGEVAKGETPVEAGLRELEEECGLVARGGRLLPTAMELAPGMGTFPHSIVVARGVEPRGVRPVLQREEGIVAVKKMGCGEVIRLVKEGQINVGATLCALALSGWLDGRRRS